MQRIVDGIIFEGNRVPDAWDVSIWEKNGHREVSARQVVEWSEIGPLPVVYDLCGALLEAKPLTPEEIEEKRQKSLKKAACRAQTMCRRVIKAEGFNEMLTITYRENQTDRALCKVHFKEWVRRMKRALGGLVDVVDPVTGEIRKKWKDGDFRYCASFEVQERGAMHVHVACHKLPKHAIHRKSKIQGWRLGTDVWHGVVGADNGLVFVGGRKTRGHSRKSIKRSPAKMAQYVSKYIMKDYKDAPEESNRYSRSNGAPLPEMVHIRLAKVDLAELIGAVFECKDGDVVVSHRIGGFKDTYWLCTERDPALGG